MKYFIAVLGVLLYLNSFGQDVIYQKDGSKIEAKVLSVTATEVFYKKFHNLKGPEYVVLRSQISIIIYENGDHEVFDTISIEHQTPINPPHIKPEKYYRRNIVATNYFDLLARRVSVSYEYISLEGTVSFRIPLSVTWDARTNSELNIGNYVRFKTGFDINFYPGGQGRVSYFVGPSFRVRKEVNNEFFRPSSGIEDFVTVGGYINNSVLFQFGENVNMSIIYGIGNKSRKNASDIDGETSSAIHMFLEGNMGIRF